MGKLVELDVDADDEAGARSQLAKLGQRFLRAEARRTRAFFLLVMSAGGRMSREARLRRDRGFRSHAPP